MSNYNHIKSNDEVLKDILLRIENKIPTSLVRKGDGENIIIGFGVSKGIKFLKYLKKF